MTMTKTNPSALSRVRDNQRRSRAQRREYVKDLEKRLRHSESRDAQATVELQAAARNVAKENALLRSLLRNIGLTDAAIADHLRASREGLETSSHVKISAANTPLQPPMWYKSPESLRASYKENLGHLFDPAIKTLVPSGSAKHPNPASTTATEVSYQPRLHDPSGLPLLPFDLALLSYESTGKDIDHPKPRELERGKPSSNATSCEIAASIIVSMRGYGNIEETQTELGCAVRTSCMVNNVEIFKVMDR